MLNTMERKVKELEDKINVMRDLINDLRDIRKVYEKPISMRNKFSIRMKITRSSREIRNRFAPDLSLLNDG